MSSNTAEKSKSIPVMPVFSFNSLLAPSHNNSSLYNAPLGSAQKSLNGSLVLFTKRILILPLSTVNMVDRTCIPIFSYLLFFKGLINYSLLSIRHE